MQKTTGTYFKNIRKVNLFVEDVPEDLIEQYKLITMFHLLEHITKPKDFLMKVTTLGVVLVIEASNVDNLMMDASKEFNDFLYIRYHVAYYTPQLLQRVVEETDLEVKSLCGNQVYGLTNHMN